MRDPSVLLPKNSPARPFCGKFYVTPGSRPPGSGTPGPVPWLLPPLHHAVRFRSPAAVKTKRDKKPADYVCDNELRRLLEKKAASTE